jgi:arylsulfatase A-like enzyme
MHKGYKNIILITIDELRADHVGFINSDSPTLTPNIDQLAKSATRFTSASSPAINTALTFPFLMASRSPLMSGYVGILDDDQTLARRMKSAGYQTGGFVAANPWLSRNYNYDIGFDHFSDFMPAYEAREGKKRSSRSSNKPFKKIMKILMDLGPRQLRKTGELIRSYIDWYCLKSINSSISAQILTNEVLAYLKKTTGRDQFIWVHYMDCHGPYVPPRTFLPDNLGSMAAVYTNITRANDFDKNTIPQDILRKTMQLYASEVKYVDYHIGRLTTFLERKGLIDNTLIVVASDHGQNFMEHGVFGHDAHPYEELIRVPLLIRGKGVPQDFEVDQAVSLSDLPRTIIELCDCGVGDDLVGKNLLTRIRESDFSPVLVEGLHGGGRIWNNDASPKYIVLAYKKGDWKVVFDEETMFFEQYNLKDDPFERNNLAVPPEQLKLTNELKLLYTIRKDEQQESREEKDPEARETYNEYIIEKRLRELGYLD